MRNVEKEAVDQIRTAINVMSCNEAEVGVGVANLHPTLQQGFARIAVSFLKEMAAKEYTDLRNEATHKLAKRLVEDLTPEDMFLPLV
jgi:hypothetical protein